MAVLTLKLKVAELKAKHAYDALEAKNAYESLRKKSRLAQGLLGEPSEESLESRPSTDLQLASEYHGESDTIMEDTSSTTSTTSRSNSASTPVPPKTKGEDEAGQPRSSGAPVRMSPGTVQGVGRLRSGGVPVPASPQSVHGGVRIGGLARSKYASLDHPAIVSSRANTEGHFW